MDLEKHPVNLYNIGVSYKKADTHIRGKFSLSKENQIALLEEAKQIGIEGLFVISTCNRTELTGFAKHPFELIQLLCKFSKGSVEEFSEVSNLYKNQEAVAQLFRIGTGLDSQILGDYEIVGQLRLAFKQAKKQQTINAYLERLMNLVLQASKKVKNQTKLSSGTTSVSYAAVQYIIQNLPDYNTKNILVFGLGKMGKHTCKNLAEYTDNKKVCLVNRTHQKSVDFAKAHPEIRVGDYSNLSSEINHADVIVVSTASETPTLTKAHIDTDKKKLILDLSMPINVAEDVSELSTIKLVNVDELSKITDETLTIRQQEIPLAEGIIQKHIDEFNEWLHHRRFTPAISILKQSLENIQKDEINFQRKKLKDFDEAQAEIITSRIIQKITTQFVKHLKDDESSANQSIQVIEKVFGATLKEIHAEDH